MIARCLLDRVNGVLVLKRVEHVARNGLSVAAFRGRLNLQR